MKNIFYSIVISIILFSCLLKAQWVQTNGPYGGSVSHVAAYLNDIGSTNFLAQNDFKGILLSTDNGRTWSSANTPFSDFSEIVQIGSNIFAEHIVTVYIFQQIMVQAGLRLITVFPKTHTHMIPTCM